MRQRPVLCTCPYVCVCVCGYYYHWGSCRADMKRVETGEGGPVTRVWGVLFYSVALRKDPSIPGSARARSFVPSSVPLGTVACGDLPRGPLRAFLSALHSHQGGLDGGI